MAIAAAGAVAEEAIGAFVEIRLGNGDFQILGDPQMNGLFHKIGHFNR